VENEIEKVIVETQAVKYSEGSFDKDIYMEQERKLKELFSLHSERFVKKL